MMQFEASATEVHASEPFQHLVYRLSRSSVSKRYDAYRDIAWDDPDARIHRFDPRFALSRDHPIGATEWYRSRPSETQAELGLEWMCQVLRYGIAFESCLSRGLLEYASTLPNGAPEYRYVMHEVVEESHHSMMFQEFINRSGCDPEDLSPIKQAINRRIARMGATFPELFFFCVLSGEIFVDHDNRKRLRAREAMHPLAARIMQIHVTEEARHVCFAMHYLGEHVPKLSAFRRWQVRVALPVILSEGERLMLRPTPRIVARFGIPKAVMSEAYGHESVYRKTVDGIVAPIAALG